MYYERAGPNAKPLKKAARHTSQMENFVLRVLGHLPAPTRSRRPSNKHSKQRGLNHLKRKE
eukprot:5048029-Amphidinium_carterae.3